MSGAPSLWIARLALPLATAVGAQAAEPSAAERLQALTRAAGQREPFVRVGLAHAHRVTIGAEGGFRVLDPASGRAVWRERFQGELEVVAEGGPLEGVSSVFRVQVGAFSDRESAERELERLAKLFGTTGVVHKDPDRNNWRVRLGRAEDRLALGPLLDRLRQQGVDGLWIAEEPLTPTGPVSLRLVDAAFDSLPTGAERLVVVPEEGSTLRVAGKRYRGIVELRISPFGTVRPINWLELEQYLKGVVPAELGPAIWPELAALEAQAVAARTYARRNLGQFSDEGFDLCDTPRCQVYDGADAEHPLSDRAVAETRGLVLTWEGRPIDALYTATCGGHTEDGREIFPEQHGPYLRGVPCRAEAEAMASLGAAVEGRARERVLDETGSDVTRDYTLLSVAGVVAPAPGSGGGAPPADAPALALATRALTRLAGLAPPAEPPGEVRTLAQAALRLIVDLGWEARARVLLASEDLPALLRDPDSVTLTGPEQRALAYWVSLDALKPHADGRFRAREPATLARLAPALVRFGDSYRAFGLTEAVVTGAGDGTVRLVVDGGGLRLRVAREAALFGWGGGAVVPVARLALWPGDRVRYRADAGGAIDFLELRPPIKGTSDDRSAKVYSWEVRKTRRELEAAVNKRVSVGRIRELEVVRRGVSGRIVELRVVGSAGSAVVRGFDVRRLLDLQESLLVIEPQRDALGEIEAVVFAGKGWGHGVGLCQVGAYGMALRGADYRQILAHYYRGARLERLGSPRP